MLEIDFSPNLFIYLFHFIFYFEEKKNKKFI